MTLAELFTRLSPKERAALAAAADLNGTYLWQIAHRWKGKRPSIGAIRRLAAADPRLSVTELVEEFSDAPQASRAGRNTPAQEVGHG